MSRKAEVSLLIKAKEAARGAIGRVGGAISRLRRTVFSLQGALGGLTVALTAKSFLKAGSSAEGYRLRLEALLGSQAEANQMFKDAAKFAGKVPFEYEQIMDSATALSGVLKGGREEVMQLLPVMTDLAAVSGLSMQETTSNFIRMWSAGAAGADMFRERGILSMLGFQAGAQYSIEETRDIVMAAYNDMDSKFRGAADKLGGAWSGMLSMVSDRWFQFRNMVNAAGLFQGAKDALEGFLRKLDQLQEDGTLQEWAEDASHFAVRAVRGVGHILGAFRDAIKFLKEHPLLTFGGLLGLFFYGPAGAVVVAGIAGLIEEIVGAMIGPIEVGEHLAARIEELGKKMEDLDRQKRYLKYLQSTKKEGSEAYNELTDRIAALNAEAQKHWQTIKVLNQTRMDENLVLGEQSGLLDDLIEQLKNFAIEGEAAAAANRGLLDVPPPPPRPDLAAPGIVGDILPEEVVVPTFWQSVGYQLRDLIEDGETATHVFGTLMVDAVQGFGDAVSGAFEQAITGQKAWGRAFVEGMLGALSAVAKGFGDFFLSQSIGEVGAALANPLTAAPHLAAAGKYALASAGMYTVAGSASGIGTMAGRGPERGNAGASGAVADSNYVSGSRGQATLIIEGGLLDMGDPRQQDSLARALSTLSGLDVTVRGTG